MLEVREEIKAGLQICNEVLNKGKCVNQEYQLFEQLALSYLCSDDHHDYPKAVGIYEYMKYLDRSKEEELNKRVRRAEEKFLQKINGCPEKIKATRQYIDSLGSFRDEISEELKITDHTAMKEMHLRAREFIIGYIITPLIDDCIEELGELPQVDERDVKYSIFCTGSIALGTMTPWSDLEFGILLEDGLSEDYTRVKAYFINLTHLLNIKVLTFGENVLHYQSIKELNDFSTGKGKDNWFADVLTTKGFCFDAALPDGSKTPFGRKHYKNAKNGKDLKSYELIGIVKEICKFQEEKEGWHESDPSLVQALNHVRFIHGKEELFQDGYLKALKEFAEINKERAFRILKEDTEKLNPNKELLDQDREGTILNVKKEIYRFPDRMIVALGDCLGGEGETTWDIIDNLVTKGKLKREAAGNLKYALNIATELRLRTYSNNKGRKEDISALARYDSSIKELQDAALVENVFYLQDLERLYRYYYVVMSLSSVLEKAKENIDLEEIIGSCANFYSDAPIVRGFVYKRFLQYYAAIGEFEKNGGRNSNIEIAALYLNVGRYKDALDRFAKILKEPDMNDHSNVAASLDNIGITYERLGEYQEALQHHQKSLKMRKRIHKDDSHDFTDSLNNIGNAYAKLKKYEKALKCHKKSLKMGIRIHKSDHPAIATSLNNKGNIHERLEQYEKALRCHKKSLKMKIRIYKGDHPAIANSLNNIGLTYARSVNQEALKYQKNLEMQWRLYKGDHVSIAALLDNTGNDYQGLKQYDEALKYLQESLEMRRRIYKDYHPDIANSLNNIGIIYEGLRQHQKALWYHQKSLEIKRKIYKGYHPDIVDSLYNIGNTYQSLGQHQKAQAKYKESSEMRKRLENKVFSTTSKIAISDKQKDEWKKGASQRQNPLISKGLEAFGTNEVQERKHYVTTSREHGRSRKNRTRATIQSKNNINTGSIDEVMKYIEEEPKRAPAPKRKKKQISSNNSTKDASIDLNRLNNAMSSNLLDTGTTSASISNVMQFDTAISMSSINLSATNQTQDQSSSLRR
ncbi:MAG: hypothetical protein K0R73_689 [Candidatus Midichloriaceae bacterium]|jgi:tetratricopeptide (TPR) repeat protein|nr:hypothetical protein [Candidatus Midichloriaceae bacterium]